MLESDSKNIDILKDEFFEKQNDYVNIKIRYPQLKNSENPTAQKINKIIKEAAINKYEAYTSQKIKRLHRVLTSH